MKDENKKPESFNSSIPDEISNELLMAYVDGELKDLNVIKMIGRSPDLKEKMAPFVWTRQLLASLKTGILDKPSPESMIDMVREGIAAQERGHSFIHDLEIMATVDGEAGFGGEEVSVPENQGEATKIFSRTGALLRRMRTGVLQEPVPENMLRLVEEGLKKKEIQAAQSPAFEIQKPVTRFFGRIVSWWAAMLGPAYSLVAVAATTILAVGLYVTASQQVPPTWEERFANLEGGDKFVTESKSWLSNDDGTFTNLTMPALPQVKLLMGDVHQIPPPSVPITDSLSISELEEVLDRMIEAKKNRVLLNLAGDSSGDGSSGGQINRIFLRAFTPVDADIPEVMYEGIQPQCIIGELVEGETANPEVVLESQKFRFCPAATNNRLTLIRALEGD
jgi:anti-sigma factor RsiW